jgi:hypothetical protein
MSKEKTTMETPGASESTDFATLADVNIPGLDIPGSSIDEGKIKLLEDAIQFKKEEIKNKQYAVSMSEETFKRFESFIENDAEWSGTESLGIKEVHKQIQKIKKEGGVKNSVIFLGALPLEASHYFTAKSKGKGLKQAEDFLSVYKPLDQAISDAKKDAMEIKELEKQLAAAMQGIELA